jgi:hypothetical protein
MSDASRFYEFAKRIVIDEGYEEEINYVRTLLARPLSEITTDFFFRQYVFVVLCSYWKEQYARKEWDRFFATGNLEVISNRRKRAAVAKGIDQADGWLRDLKVSEDPIEFLDTLPMIGEVTKYHLARNIGIDCVKPDRHLIRVAEFLNFKTPLDLCITIREEVNEPLGVIDVVIWRMCNLTNIWKEISFK